MKDIRRILCNLSVSLKLFQNKMYRIDIDGWMGGWMNALIDGWMGECLSRRMNGLLDEWMGGRLSEWMGGWMGGKMNG